MNNWRDKLYRFMQGRYGRIDELGRFLMYLLFGLLLVSFFVRSSIFSLLILISGTEASMMPLARRLIFSFTFRVTYLTISRHVKK